MITKPNMYFTEQRGVQGIMNQDFTLGLRTKELLAGLLPGPRFTQSTWRVGLTSTNI